MFDSNTRRALRRTAAIAIDTGVEGIWGGVSPRPAGEGMLSGAAAARRGDAGAACGGAAGAGSLSVSGSRGGST